MLTLRKIYSGLLVVCMSLLVISCNNKEISSSQQFLVECLSEKDFVLNVSDEGYSADLPIDMQISFSLDEKGLVKQDTVKTVCSKTHTAEYSGVVAYVDSINSEEVLSLDIKR